MNDTIGPANGIIHDASQFHHHHTHTAANRHPQGRHLLQVEDLNIGFLRYGQRCSVFETKQTLTPVIEALSLSVHEGEILAIVGASGSGKSVLAHALIGLFEPNAHVSGRICFDGSYQTSESLALLRGGGIALVPQSVESLDPLMRVGKQVEGFGFAESPARRKERRRQLFQRYRLDESVAALYPHELSGGMARRVLLCCALMDDPRLLIADEPTPGLDLPLAVRAMQDFRAFADEGGGVILITHDIRLALQTADRLAVFQKGTIVEETAVEAFASAETLRHPFSKALWHALPEHGFAPAFDQEGASRIKEDFSSTGTPLFEGSLPSDEKHPPRKRPS